MNIRPPAFEWQEGYFACSVSRSQVPALIRYSANQKKHHHEMDSATEFELLLKRHGLELRETSPWASELSRDALVRAARNSLCFSLFEENRQIGFARVITDFATYAYLCDVYVMETWRGRGLGSWLIRCVLAHPEIAPLKRIALITHDAQDFYLKLGFHFASKPDRYMERLIQSNRLS